MQDHPILQSRLPHLAWVDPRTRRLPGILPVEGQDWLRVDEAYAPQMALRDRLIAERPEVVHALLPEARPAAAELYAATLDWLRTAQGFDVGTDTIRRPDGVTVPLDPDQPLLTLGRLVQEDLCLMETAGEEYRLTGAILCFPASWTLAQKIGRPLTGIHDPVPIYDQDIARRVNRLFDAIRPEQPLWRMNYLTYDDFVLHQPRREGEKRPRPTDHVYIRSERQCLLRLPVTKAVVFTIHTYVVDASTVTPEELGALREAVH
ncbi:heme-dependent oxidative N-demethylase family protein [Tabrizicola sp.]|uniref:heme-dependent oxidative N-demethylase family protein n=1 Tax=Tabrizicola sp. TaxID=2005166 RepID=UPI003F35375F